MRRALLVATLAALAACRAQPAAELVPAEELPARWTGAEADASAPPSSWWRGFDDPRIEPLVAEALEHNHDLGAAVDRLQLALAGARDARGALAPRLDAGADVARRRQNFVGLPIPGGGVLSSTSTTYGVSLDLSWEVDLWGRLRAAADASDAEARAAAADVRGAALSLAAQTVKGWFALVEARAQVELARATASSFEENADWIRARYERGLSTPLDLRLALSNAADARAALAAAEDRAQRSARALEVLLGRYPAGQVEGAEELPPLPAPPPAGLPAELLERRPDLVAARERVAAADERVASSRAAMLPGLSLTAGGGRLSSEVGDLLDGEFDVWSLGASLAAPLFQGGRLRAQVDAAEARRAEAWSAWESTLLVACAEVESALAAESRLARRVDELEESVREARAAEALAQSRYRGGVETLVTLLEAQRRSVSSQSRRLVAQRDLLDNRVDLLLALGGGFDDAPTAPERDRGGPAVKTLLRWLLPVIVLVAGVAGARWLVESRPEVETHRPEIEAPIVRTLVAERSDARLAVESTGSVRPLAQVRLVAEVEGRVLSVSPRLVAGGFVAAGETLAQIDRRDYELALVRARSEVARAQASLEREQAEADVAREQWSDLGEGEASSLALREPQLAEARAALEAARAAQAEAELDLERTRLSLPFDARVRSERVDVGQYVSRAEELATLYPTDRVEVLLPVPSADLFALELPAQGSDDGPEVELSADWAGARRTWRGRVVRSEGEIDARTRMVPLVAEVRDPFGLEQDAQPSGAPLELGLFVHARILGRTLEDVIAIPRSALRGADSVWVVDDELRLRQRQVTLARAEEQTVYVTAGLGEGERVCLSVLEAPVDGMHVRLADADETGAAETAERDR